MCVVLTNGRQLDHGRQDMIILGRSVAQKRPDRANKSTLRSSESEPPILHFL